MNEEKTVGYLIVKVSTASGAIPVEKATVIIQGNEDYNKDLLISLTTNSDGLTDRIPLPAPARILSEAPDPSSKPYSTYNIDVYKEGYYPQHYNSVPIFEGITAVQNARIIPSAEFDVNGPYYTQSQIFDEYENPDL